MKTKKLNFKKRVKAYKVCLASSDGNHSAIYTNDDVNCRRAVDYEVYRLTFPHQNSNPFLFVFTKLKDAQRFQNSRPYPKMNCILMGIAFNPRIKARGVERVFYAKNFPAGTKFCDSFLPLEKLRP